MTTSDARQDDMKGGTFQSPFRDAFTDNQVYTPDASRKRKRVSVDADQSPSSADDDALASRVLNGTANSGSRAAPLKRACNECRQQKVRPA